MPWVCLVSQDAFYRVLNTEQMALAHKNEFDFDHPDAMDLTLMAEVLRKLKAGKQVEVCLRARGCGRHGRREALTTHAVLGPLDSGLRLFDA